MTVSYKIIVDAAGDFFPGTLETYSIPVVPMEVTVGDTSFTYTPDIDPDQILEYYTSLKEGSKPTTSQVTAYQYNEFFTPFLEQGEDILYLSLDSAISGMCDQAILTSRDLKNKYPERQIEVVDTLSATAGIGLLLERAIKNKEEGLSLLDNANDLRKHSKSIVHLFVVEDLYHLKRGGRISALTAMVTTALNIKPILYVSENGELLPLTKARGMRQSMKEIANLFDKSRLPEFNDQVIISHSLAQKSVDMITPMIQNITGNDKIPSVITSPVIGAHVGTGMLALCFYGRRNP
ncbi:MAG: DegV family protein [Tissierellia bacterium]|nr:DegV family protein [Tissierellia bacterium]